MPGNRELMLSDVSGARTLEACTIKCPGAREAPKAYTIRCHGARGALRSYLHVMGCVASLPCRQIALSMSLHNLTELGPFLGAKKLGPRYN